MATDEVALPPLEDQVPDGDGGEVALEAHPLLPAVCGEEEPELRAREEQVLLDRVFEQGVHGASLGQVARDGDPRLPGIGALQRVGLEVAPLVVVEGGVEGLRVDGGTTPAG